MELLLCYKALLNVQGDVVWSNYGYKSNEELLLGYGFVLEPNLADFFHVSLGLGSCGEAAQDLQQQERVATLLAKLGLPTQNYLTRAAPLPAALVAAAAVCYLPESQAYELLASAMPEAHTSPQPASATAACSKAHRPYALPGGSDEAECGTKAGSSPAAVPGLVEVRPAPQEAAAAPAVVASTGSAASSAAGQVLQRMPVGVRLAALRSIRAQLQRKVAELQGGPAAEDRALAAAAAPGSGAYQALVRGAWSANTGNLACMCWNYCKPHSNH